MKTSGYLSIFIIIFREVGEIGARVKGWPGTIGGQARLLGAWVEGRVLDCDGFGL